MNQQRFFADEEDKVASLFQPDTLLSAEYFERLRKKALDPEKKLMLAIIEEAIASYQRYLGAENRKGKALFADAEKWIWNEDGNWVFSFENICEALGLTPTYIRCGLLRWREKELSSRRDLRIIQSSVREPRAVQRVRKKSAWMKKISTRGKKIA